MEIEVGFHPEAREEYLSAIAWYVTHSEPIATAFQREVQGAIDQIQADPTRSPKFEGEVRWVRLKRFPYVVYFEPLTTQVVQVLAVAHGSRAPGYWRSRK